MGNKHILIVDDEPRVAYLLSRALERTNKGYHVTIAHSGEEALEVLERSPVDLLVTDLRMPGISGLDLIRWVRASSPRTRTILITAYGDDEVEAEAHRLEAYRYITKPFDMADFTRAVQEALREVALAQPGWVVLSDECFEAIATQLESLRQETGAQCVFLADMQGQRLVEVGDSEGLDTAALLALQAGGIAASAELARQLGDDSAFNLNFHEGSRYDLYAASVGESLFLSLVCDRQIQPSRIGLVWLYTRRAIERLRALLSSAQAPPPSLPIGEEFGASLAAELDALLQELPSGEAPASEATAPGPDAPQVPNHVPSEASDEGEEDPRETTPAEAGLLGLEEAIRLGVLPPDFLKSERNGDDDR